MGKLEDHIKDQMFSTANNPALVDHRDLVEGRWKQLRGFALAETSPGKLSPGSLSMKNDFFGDDQKKLTAPLLKSFKKKFAGYMQSLTNASDRLNEVHREECILFSTCLLYDFCFVTFSNFVVKSESELNTYLYL